MSQQTEVGYQAFAQWERKMARRKAEKLVHDDLTSPPARRAGLNRSDIPDLEQEMLLQIHLKRGRFDPAHHSGASLQSFIGYALDKFGVNLARDRKRLKRGGGTEPVSLSRPVSAEEDEDTSIGDMITDECWPDQPGVAPSIMRTLGARQPEPTLRFDADRLLAKLNARQREIGRRIMQGHEMTEIGSSLGISRAELYREVGRMRRTLYEEGLRDYLG